MFPDEPTQDNAFAGVEVATVNVQPSAIMAVAGTCQLAQLTAADSSARFKAC
jgi:hypothetical protein